jgi:hypothetical protein
MASSGWARVRIGEHQRKLHRWAIAEPHRRFGEVFNLVCDQATLSVAWERVSGNRGAKTAGVDAMTRRYVEQNIGVMPFVEGPGSAQRGDAFPGRVQDRRHLHRWDGLMTPTAKPVAPASVAPLAADLDAALRRLKLATVRRNAAEVLQVAKTQRWTPEEILRTLVEAEIAARDASNTATASDRGVPCHQDPRRVRRRRGRRSPRPRSTTCQVWNGFARNRIWRSSWRVPAE